MTPSMLAMGRRRAEVEAVAAAVTVGEVVVEAVDLARARMDDPFGGHMNVGTAQAVGERPLLEPHPCVSCACMPIPSAPGDTEASERCGPVVQERDGETSRSRKGELGSRE